MKAYMRKPEASMSAEAKAFHLFACNRLTP